MTDLTKLDDLTLAIERRQAVKALAPGQPRATKEAASRWLTRLNAEFRRRREPKDQNDPAQPTA